MNAARGAKRVWAIAKKEVMHIRRDPWTFWFALGMPVLLLVLFGYAVSFDIDHIPVVVVDQDRTPASRELVRHLFTGQTFRREADVDDAVAAEAAFRRGEARLAVVIPPDYGVHVARGGRAEVQLLIDAADNQNLRLSARNLDKHQFLPPEGVNVYDVLRHEHLILTKGAVAALEARCK